MVAETGVRTARSVLLRWGVFVISLTTALISGTAWITALRLPNAGAAELSVLAIAPTAFAALALWVLLDRRHVDKAALTLCALASAMVVLRVAQVALGPVADDQNLPVFMPVFAYLPGIYIATMVFAPGRAGAGLSVGAWLMTALAATPGAWAEISSGTPVRSGAEQLLFYLWVANPAMLVGLGVLMRSRLRDVRTLGGGLR